MNNIIKYININNKIIRLIIRIRNINEMQNIIRYRLNKWENKYKN